MYSDHNCYSSFAEIFQRLERMSYLRLIFSTETVCNLDRCLLSYFIVYMNYKQQATWQRALKLHILIIHLYDPCSFNFPIFLFLHNDMKDKQHVIQKVLDRYIQLCQSFKGRKWFKYLFDEVGEILGLSRRRK